MPKKKKESDIIKTPKAQLPVISNKQLIRQFANSGYKMFKGEPKDYSKQPEQERSLFFQAELNNEKRRF
jgi:hypothetical protein